MRVLRFGLVGLTVTLAFTGMNKVFAAWWGPQKGFLAAYLPAIALHFCLNKWWTFGSERTDTGRQIAQYLLMVAVTFCIQWVVFTALLSLVKWPSWVDAAVANVAQMGITFVAMQWKIFGRAAEGKPNS